MMAPAVAHIEMAMDRLKLQEHWLLKSETHEFNSLGAVRHDQIVEALADLGIEEGQMLAGYLLGLETARALLSTMPAAVQAGVEI